MAEILHYRDFKKPAERWSCMEGRPTRERYDEQVAKYRALLGDNPLDDTAPAEYCAPPEDCA